MNKYRFYNAEVADAIRGSIEKWKAIIEGRGEDHGKNNCPLCSLFIKNGCSGCPIESKVDDDYCCSTPYEDWSSLRTLYKIMMLDSWREDERGISIRDFPSNVRKEALEIAQCELNFLEELLQEYEESFNESVRVANYFIGHHKNTAYDILCRIADSIISGDNRDENDIRKWFE